MNTERPIIVLIIIFFFSLSYPHVIVKFLKQASEKNEDVEVREACREAIEKILKINK
ncbi:unnamed protein product [marine sediment metagenome]|uniref:Uncharacterized protein n=1 Tax=marine sediment metagenome TaxID=412755 RepID=X0YXJ3_9ZZZZ